ncbi:serine/threonine-protein kinase [Halobacillus sp. KGW1]|uniref:serine/threonine-protein kinase n=1 Tax=Halobacillus sp. KGW1 TaxID=1793726 RepID=UPI000783086A|nr:serine/threonine-protein kinase [Halobacillus sp. KGW1]
MLMVNTLLRVSLEEDIGQEGRNSNVHIAFDPQLDARLVIKKIPKSDFTQAEDFFNEAKMLYATTHPNIMGVRYATQDKENIYISMDYYKNGSLNSLMSKKHLTVKEIVRYSLEFLSGLHFMHTKNLVHFDIKPTNILLNDANRAVVTDFGLAKYLNENGFANPDKSYPLHIPPETFKFNKSSTFSDVYQAGLTIYRMCNGNEFFHDQYRKLNITNSDELAEAIIKNKFPKRNSFLPHIPNKFQQIIKKAINPNVEERYESVLEMMNDLSTVDCKFDWRYNQHTNTHSSWTRENETHIFVLELKKDDDEWFTEGRRIRKSDNKTNKMNKCFTNGYNTKDEAFKSVKALLEV